MSADNLETFGSDYYKRRTLYFTVGENDPLYKQCFAKQVVDADNPQVKRQKQWVSLQVRKRLLYNSNDTALGVA